MSSEPKRIRVLFVEDHQLLADALSALLAREPDMEVVGIAGTVADAKMMSRERSMSSSWTITFPTAREPRRHARSRPAGRPHVS